MKISGTLIRIQDLQLKTSSGKLQPLPDIEIAEKSCIAVCGPNGSGKTFYSRVMAGEILPDFGVRTEETPLSGRIHLVSFDAGLRLLEAEKKNDESDLNGGAPDLGRSVAAYLDYQRHKQDEESLLHRFHLDSLLERGLRALSSGELRKVMILKALSFNPLLLILDDPFDGLDIEAQGELKKLLQDLKAHCALVIITGRRGDVPDFCDKLVLLKDSEGGHDFSGIDHTAHEIWAKLQLEEKKVPLGEDSSSLIEMRNVKNILSRFPDSAGCFLAGKSGRGLENFRTQRSR